MTVTARRIVWGKYLNAGQTCIAPDYLLVEESIKDRLIDALREQIAQFYGDDPQQSNDYGRIIHEQHWQRLTQMLDSENVVIGGDFDKRERYIAPTVIDGVSGDSSLMQEEIFGPLRR